MIVEKKAWPELFEKLLKREKNCDLRLADLEISKGDILVLREFNPEIKQFTGRRIERKVTNVNKINELFKWWSEKEIKEKGLLLIELE